MTYEVRVSQVVAGMVVSLSMLAGCATIDEQEPRAPELEEPSRPPDEAAGADDEQAALLSSGHTGTRYPIVLCHGMSGWKELLGVLDYFHGIVGDLRSGGARVYVTSVAAFGPAEVRGEQLLAQVEYIVAASGAGKVNLIGHSMGGIDVRYVAAVRPDLVASVTTVGTPHEGALLADWFLANTKDGGFSQVVVDTLGNALGFALNLLAGTDHPQDTIAALRTLSSAGMDAFNARYPQGMPSVYCGNGPESQNGIRFYSWTGTSTFTNLLDPTDGPLAVTSLLSGRDNDGLVDRCSARFGRVIYDRYRMNHLDEVNQTLGLVSLFETNPKSLFRAHANRLKNAGL